RHTRSKRDWSSDVCSSDLAAPKLQVVARAGVALDNVDVDAATKAGVLVVNAPTSNIISAAEQAINLLLATARNTAPAHNALVNEIGRASCRQRRRNQAGVE